MKYRRGAIISLLLLGTCSEETRQGRDSESSHLALGVIPASESAVWQRIGGSSNPDGRHLQAAAFDEDRKVFVMFGGAVMAAMRGQAQPSQEIWEWNPADGRWSNRTGTGTAPSARSGAAMVYLPDQKKFLLFGGRAGSGFNYEDTWTWDPATGAWADLTNAGDHPSVRGQHAMVYERSTKKVLLFGGARGTSSYYTGDEVSVSLGDTWEWDPATGAWSARSVVGGPSARHDVGMVWDSGRNQVVLFGGMSMDIAGATGAVKQDVWDWDPQAGTWTEKTPAGNKPRPRYGHAAAFDASRDKTLVFGGVDIDTGDFLNELWEWDGATGVWSERTTTGPSGRAHATLVYDATRARLNLVAGVASGTLPTGGTGGYTTIAGMFVGLNEVWELDPATASFSNRTSASDLPSPRAEHSMAYSPSTQTAFVFGGVDMQGRRFSDLWEWNGSKWTSIAAVGPQARSGAGLAYDPRRKTLILFGGTDSSGRTSFNDTWELDTTSKKWIPLKTATLPDALWAHGMVTDTTHGKILVFGGYINGGRGTSSKVWEWDGDALTWTDRTPPASSSSPTPRTYPQLAYDEGRQKLFLFDGPAFSTGGSISAFWEWDPVSYGWQQRDPKDQLAKSYLDFAVYDSIRRREVILTNGYDSTGQLQTLELDARKPTWYVRTVANTPSERRNATMVFDSHRGVAVLFGGTRSDGTYLNETWEYKVTGSGNGVGCTQAFASSCASGNCVEGVCCEAAACTGACKSCNVPELEGTCVLAKAGTEVAGSCSNGQACDGNGNCKSRNGQACSDASACATGLCVDGVCCDSACTGACASCNNPGQAGKCSPYAAGTDPQNECGVGTGVCKSACDGVGNCAYPKETRSCGTCLTCDGAGNCSLPDRTCVGGSGGSVRGGSTGTTPIGGAGGAIPMGGAGGAGGGTGRGGSTGTIPSGGGGYVPNGGSVASGGVARGGTVGSGGVGGVGGTVTGRGGSGGSGGTVTGRGGSGGSGGAISSSRTGGAVRTGGMPGNTGGTGGKRDAGAPQGGGSGTADAGSNVRLNSSGCDCDLGRTGPSATLSSAPLFLAGLALLLRRRRRAKGPARSPAGH